MYTELQSKKDVIWWACSICGKEKFVQNLIRKPLLERPCARPRNRQKNIKMCSRNLWCEGIDWILLGVIQWWTSMNTDESSDTIKASGRKLLSHATHLAHGNMLHGEPACICTDCSGLYSFTLSSKMLMLWWSSYIPSSWYVLWHAWRRSV